jgi:hypothetical protein
LNAQSDTGAGLKNHLRAGRRDIIASISDDIITETDMIGLKSNFYGPSPYPLLGTAHAVRAAIFSDERLFNSSLSVLESGGIIFIDGIAPTCDAIDLAVSIARSVTSHRVISRAIPEDLSECMTGLCILRP